MNASAKRSQALLTQLTPHTQMATLEDKSLWENQQDDDLEAEIYRLSNEEITNRARLLENDIKVSTFPIQCNDRSGQYLCRYLSRGIFEIMPVAASGITELRLY
jgi:hypothetical protein